MTINKSKYNMILANSGLSSDQVAEAAGITRARLNAIVNQKQVRPETAGKIARALCVDVSEIIVQQNESQDDLDVEKQKWETTLNIVLQLKELSVDKREQWKQIVLKEMPEMKDFVDAALATVDHSDQKDQKKIQNETV